MGDNKFNATLDKIRLEYINSLKGKLFEIEKLHKVVTNDSSAFETISQIKNIAHKLSGSGKTFGLPIISEDGKQLELCAIDALEELKTQDKISTYTRELFNSSVDQLLFHSTTSHNPVSLLETEDTNLNSTTTLTHKPTILMLAPNTVNTETITQQLSFVGYLTQRLDKISDISAAVFNTNPAAIIIQTEFNSKINHQIKKTFARIKKHQELPPVIYICSNNDFETRLNALRLDGKAFLSLPFDTVNLIDQLSELIRVKDLEHCHVLIIDDDEILAKHYAVTLENEGITVTVLSNPREALQVLHKHAIDLVLLDFNMPDCNGFELATMLRQLDHYIRLPIIFLSAEANLEKLTRNSQLGIDDFLSKPITSDTLVTAVTNRIQRSLVLRKFMDQDSATGLLNHTRLKKELHHAVIQAKDHHNSFCYALIDIDHFKKVNDTHGHGIGDIVLKTLAHLLKQRLRHTDIIGRYGGEEFGVILKNVNSAEALTILKQIHHGFGEFKFIADNQEFRVTFSAGIAEYPKFKTDITLSQAADDALYKAKNQGRNCLVIAD